MSHTISYLGEFIHISFILDYFLSLDLVISIAFTSSDTVAVFQISYSCFWKFSKNVIINSVPPKLKRKQCELRYKQRDIKKWVIIFLWKYNYVTTFVPHTYSNDEAIVVAVDVVLMAGLGLC
jgi:hypothetical protein